MEAGKETIREGLATLINCSPDEIAIFRNATEALNNAIFGIELNAGDEVVACKQDYVKTISSWKQRELREGIKIVWVDLAGTETNDEIVAKFVSAFSAKTKVVQITHVINWNGFVLPAKDIIQAAKARNILTVLDAAHSFGILDTDVADLACDYMGTALHKWLSGPIPSGMLYIRKKNIERTWPLASGASPLSDNIRKFEELSIQLLPNVIGLGYAIEFHLNLGREYKEHRLRHLRRYWIDKVKGISGVKFNTPFVEEQCAVIANMALQGWDPPAFENELLKKYYVHVGIVLLPNLQGIRVTPNIYTTLGELDSFVDAFASIAKG
jgi:selenocysteine lyase/cysteine desulfurase